MAKTVRQQLADLASGKKPNVFYKGLNTDTDEHLIGNDQFTEAVNVRLNSKDSDLGTLQNLQSNKKEYTLGLPGWVLKPATVSGKFFWANDGVLDLNSTNALLRISLQFQKTTNNTFVQFTGNTSSDDYIDIDFSATSFIHGRSHQSSSQNYSNNDVILHIYDSLKANTLFTSVMDVALGFKETQLPDNFYELYFFPKDTSFIPNTTLPMRLSSVIDNVNQTKNPTENGYNFVVDDCRFGADGFKLYPIAIESYTNYIAAVCFHSSTIQSVVKIFTNANGSVSSIEPVIVSNFGIASKTTGIVIQKVEENENFNRIYWTDGINPIKTVNLEASGSFYNNFTSEEDFNLFPKSPLRSLEIENVTDSGSINCGSWSYTYRLKTPDGKSSVYAPLTNPLPLTNTSINISSHLVEGGVISDNSGKSVTLKIQDVPKFYSIIELIGIQYIDDVGAVFYKIKEESLGEQLTESQVNFITHNGNEQAVVITGAEVLTKKNTWDVAQDLEVKDSRLFAANLKNNTSEIISDFNTFRVKSYKHSAGSSTFGTPASGAYSSYSGFINPDLYEAELYKIAGTDTAKYRYAQGDTNTRDLSFGANTDDYHNSQTGVYVTFKLKQFDLNDISYYHSTRDTGDSDGVNIPPFTSTSRTTVGGYNNYKNSVFANKFVGYMRDEVYRFGIQFYDKNGNQSFTYPIGDIRFPSIENDLRVIGTTPSTYTTTTTNQPNKYILADANGKGYILYPEFRIKLADSIIKQISGFNIVRAERSDSNKRILTAGMLNQTLIYANSVDNGVLKNKIGIDKMQLFAQKTDAYDAFNSELYTLDSPEVLFGRLNYTKTGTERLKICSKFLAKPFNQADKPKPGSTMLTPLDIDSDSWGVWQKDSSTSSPNHIYYAASLDVDYTTTPNIDHTFGGSCYTIYFCDDSATSPLASTSGTGHYDKAIFYGQNVGNDEFVSNALLGSTQDFQNRTEIYDTSGNNVYFAEVATSGGLAVHDPSIHMLGNKTLLISLANGSYFTYSNQYIFHNQATTPFITQDKYYAAKAYAKIIRVFTNDSGQYGGNTESALVSQRWISTGASLHGNSITSNEMILDVFGGDTYINMFSQNKFLKPSYNTNNDNVVAQGLIYPVESSINLDMRRGTYFGKNKPNLQVEDDYLCASSYSAKNSIKSFPAKNPTIVQVTNFQNLIAASNVKIAGQTSDAFSVFDANENFELNMNYGPIQNIIAFRDVLYAIQEKAVSILSVNTRALINTEDGSAISIQSALGTGNVIERSDYINTKHGSQNRINAVSTDMGLYWIDNNNSSICAIEAKQPNLVVNLSQQKNISKLLDSIKGIKINNNPLNISTTTGNEGGINISYNSYLNELLFSITYFDSEVTQLSIAYDESLGVFLGTRSYVTLLNCTHEGNLFSVGYASTQTITDTDDQRREIYSHDTTSTTFSNFYGVVNSNPSVTFVNNEEIVSLKVYDKIVISTEESDTNGIFSIFAYNTNIDSLLTMNLSEQNIDKVVVGKQIVPVFVSKRMKGNYLKVHFEQSVNKSSQKFNLFSVTSHYRKNII